MNINDQPIGFPVPNWTPRPRPPRTPMTGRFCRVEPVDVAAHAQDLYDARYEWKCDHLNGASRRAAERYGFTFEGIFRQATVYKGRSRDTAWFSIVDPEWPGRKAAFEQWLRAENFDDQGRQRLSLG